MRVVEEQGDPARGPTIFKSAGTRLQDVTIAALVYERAVGMVGHGTPRTALLQHDLGRASTTQVVGKVGTYIRPAIIYQLEQLH